jgi:DNA repair exonuclease SbcCD ATPase subunit
LANRLSDLESRLSMEVREKAQLKERQEHAELIQADLHRSKIELESALKNSENARMEQSKRFEAEIRGLRDAFSESQMGHQRELSKAERRGEELEQVLEENKRASEALLSRVQALEETNRESLTRLEELSSQERSHERHSAEKLNDAEMRTSEVLMRIETMEKNLLPSAKQYIDGTFQTYWGPTQAEIQGVHRELGELAGRIGRVDSASADTVQSIKEEADRGYRRVIDTLNDTIKTTLDRFGNVEAAMDEERRKRDEVGRRVGEEVEKLKAQMAESLQSADKDHAGLVEAVHSRMMQRLSQQEDLTSVLSEAIEGKRAFLEEVVRAEIKSRFDSVEQLRGEIASKASDLDEAFDKVREEVRAQSKLLAVKLRSATRTVKNAANESEQTRRLAEQATQDIGREMQGMTQQSLQVENELRAAFKAGLGDLQLQISAVRQLAEQGGGGAPAVSQERRDEGQDERISGVREQCVALASEVDALKHALEQEAARAKREEGLLRDRQDDILGDAARRTHESLARVEGELQRQSTRTETAENALHQAKMRVEALEEDVVSGPRKVLEELGAKIERGEEAQRSSEERMNARIRELHDTCLTVYSIHGS